MSDLFATPQTVYAVSELTEVIRGLLEDALPSVWVEGEISNFARPASGHWYFTLKDERAQLRCVMFKRAAFLVRPVPRDGDRVRVRGQLGLYEARGDLQLIGEAMEPAGQGALLLAFERLKARLQAEGLFDAALKRPIPAAPRAIGLITSATGAAAADVLTALARRFPLTQVFLYPVPVQGAEAAPAIVRALDELPRRVEVDVVLLVRGGGSLEDLWSFNEEAVARAIRACAKPVIVGVGHEIDTTIADFAADLRAPTPTAAAELASPDLRDWLSRCAALESALVRALALRSTREAERLARATQRLRLLDPRRRLQDRAQRLDELDLRLRQNQQARLRRLGQTAAERHSRLIACRPLAAICARRETLQRARQHLEQSVDFRRRKLGDRLNQLEALLASFNPQAVLRRGYAIARNAQGRIVTGAEQVSAGEALNVQLARGELRTRVQP